MFLKFFITIYILFIGKVISSPILFLSEDESFKKKMNSCGSIEKKISFQFKEKHFDLKEFDRVNQEILDIATQSAKVRVSQIICIKKLKLTELELSQLKKSLDLYKDLEENILEYYNRWLYSFEKKNIMTPMDKKYTSEFLLLKYDLYNLLHNKTNEFLLGNVSNQDEFEYYEERVMSIYHSILKGKFEYYNSITPEFRKEILKKNTD